MIYAIQAKSKVLTGKVSLPASKSESNRLLIIRALTGAQFQIENLSEAEDTKLLNSLLELDQEIMDCGAAGTTFRFLTGFLACQEDRLNILTGSERMKQRPIGSLVDALRQLGASIDYLEREGYPPIRIKGKKLKGGEVVLDGSISSQYISALLLIAPALSNGLRIKIQGPLVSKPYVDMTMKVMQVFGVTAVMEDNVIAVSSGKYQPTSYQVQQDWSAASYWYEMAALSEKTDLLLEGLHAGSVQGDEVVAELYKIFGVSTSDTEAGIRIVKSKQAPLPDHFECDFSACPDLAQTMATTCAALGMEAEIAGIANLKIKETNRIDALATELKKIGVGSDYKAGSFSIFKESVEPIDEDFVINTYDDHRMAMAFAPLALIKDKVHIRHPEVVEKSYPEFWKEMKKFFLIDTKP